MLSPVTASVQAQPLSSAAVGQREARSDGPNGVVPVSQAAQSPAAAAPQPGVAVDMLQSLRHLAEMLGSQQVDAEDILTRLAIDFAAALGESPLPDETPRDFASRLANVIRQLPEAARLLLAATSNLASLGISLDAFATALADPASPAAARLVAHAEDPGAQGMQQKLQAAIDSYEQNGAAPTPTPVDGEAEALAQKTEGDAGAAGKSARDAATAEKNPAAQAATALPMTSEATAGARALEGEAAARQRAAAILQANGTPEARTGDAPAAPARAAAAATKTMAEAHLADHSEGQPTMQVLRGFNVVVANVAGKAAEVLKTVTALAQQAEEAQTFQPAGSAVAEAVRKSGPLGPTTVASQGDIARDAAPVIAGKAHEAARAMEGKVVPLFSGAVASEDVDNIDIARIIKIAEQTMARTDAARVPDMALAQARLPEGVPFAQVPYPFVKEEEEKARRRGFGEQAGGDEDENLAGGEEGAMSGDGEAGQRRDEPEIEERPFEAEEPLKRNATDAERAFHTYQRFGGF